MISQSPSSSVLDAAMEKALEVEPSSLAIPDHILSDGNSRT